MNGWSGTVVVASFPKGGYDVRVLPSPKPAPLDTILAADPVAAPFAAIDGGFYDREGQPMGLVRTGGRDVAPLRKGGGSGVFVYTDGVAHVVHRDRFTAGTEALQSIDRIVSGGASLVRDKPGSRRAARSAVALDAAGGLHLVVAYDQRAVVSQREGEVQLGPHSASSGPTLAQMATLLTRSPGAGGVQAEEALGMDGGISTALTVDNGAQSLHVRPFNATINALAVQPSGVAEAGTVGSARVEPSLE